jgi:hypothetical protein
MRITTERAANVQPLHAKQKQNVRSIRDCRNAFLLDAQLVCTAYQDNGHGGRSW